MMSRRFIILFAALVGLWASSSMAAEPTFIFDQLRKGEPSSYPAAFENKDPATLSVLWWNIREGGLLSKQSPENPLEKNLIELAHSKFSPDVLFLGEYAHAAFAAETELLLKIQYPYQLYIPYGLHRSELGIQVYSRYEFGNRIEVLDWSPFKASPEERATFKQKWRAGLNSAADRFYERTFSDLTLQKDKHLFHLIPVHLLNPWMPLAKKIGKVKAGLVMMFGSDNPHYRQVERLVTEKIKPLLKVSKQERSSLLLIGDFNVPDQMAGLMPKGYQLIDAALKPVTSLLFSDFTFPAVTSDMKAQPHLKIDHAFVGRTTKVSAEARILLKGSDHYPIAVLLKPLP